MSRIDPGPPNGTATGCLVWIAFPIVVLIVGAILFGIVSCTAAVFGDDCEWRSTSTGQCLDE